MLPWQKEINVTEEVCFASNAYRNALVKTIIKITFKMACEHYIATCYKASESTI